MVCPGPFNKPVLFFFFCKAGLFAWSAKNSEAMNGAPLQVVVLAFFKFMKSKVRHVNCQLR